MLKNILPLLILLFVFNIKTEAQELSVKQIKNLIESFKKDPRGPYNRIKWFCDDGSEREPRDPCPDSIGGGIQHASFKSSVISLRKTNQLYFSDIIASLKEKEFLDESNNYSRLKQYQINKYLASVNDGWILQKAQYYRGAVQSEDEETWGKEFFESVLKNDYFITNNFYLIRQALKDVPHNGDDNVAQLMRSQSKTISEDMKAFMDIRIKIHGQPEITDIMLVKNFMAQNKIPEHLKKDFDALIETMYKFYSPIDFNRLEKELQKLPASNSTTKKINAFIVSNKNDKTSASFVSELANILSEIRHNILSYKSGKDRLQLLDLSNQLEHTLLTETQNWETETIGETLDKISVLSCAAMGTGLIENWEYNAIETSINNKITKSNLTVNELNELLTTSRSIVEWSASMVKANYQEIVDKYTVFEPLSYSFIDDRVRSSIALSLGEAVSDFGAFVSKTSNINNDVMDIENQSAIRGLNPGYAFGELVVVDGNPDNIEVNTNNIYIFEKPPHDLKPVAGIMTVSEGNLVSHVQLLARNLGIPNAALSYNNLKAMKKYNGEKVFYAVSNKGNVILKSEDDMSSTEKELFSKRSSIKFKAQL
ncbi:MAG: hypothetical protein ACPG41_04565 [Lacinutrix venerupis]